ncbi:MULTISPECIES: undecaprenyl-diphosphate phosphatase [Dictyoglomus]|jgi:undecaprenyl-diphosphatase|uniref:Undecaprenyl-diphosphatase n=1 Tax=Dictyoglomus turgidum (strain DSM 6724 / Z-1310) TaxID=515635 RepID=B8DYR6_DICTD|nr:MULTISPECIES: undecaprenyl-diphosphate phosphatase [Dictyoglomus]ACK41448.1 Bacitracin resistance protein BacA [Dictyoglomus turgidum DSM 6724]PNV79126.1 MAG: undecaprenyl-diphosphate phosphatase [Dictyoglomus turgidum]HBU31837.1 undecaprenyl-diphosphate phosphatase [Dictyoglomus sp.]
MNIWVIILGIVQGITEFLPISSTAHLILIPYLVKIPDFGLSFDVGLHLGTFWAVLIYFLKDWWEFLVSIFKGGEKRRILGLIVLATLPAGILGVFLDPFVEKISQPQVYSFAIWIILIGVISFGIIFLLLEKYSKKNLEIKDLNLKRGLIIGFWQVLSLFPGVSRSGSTISGGMFTGLKRDEATKFSFYLSLPIIGGAVFFKLFHVIKSGDLGSLSLILWGAIVAFIVGILTIHLLLNYVKKASLKVFSYYRFILALAILLAYFNLQVLSLIVFGVAIVYLIFRMVRGEKERN